MVRKAAGFWVANVKSWTLIASSGNAKPGRCAQHPHWYFSQDHMAEAPSISFERDE